MRNSNQALGSAQILAPSNKIKKLPVPSNAGVFDSLGEEQPVKVYSPPWG